MSHMTIGSCKEFHDNVLDLILAATAADLHIEALEPAYSQAVAQLAGIVNRQRAYVSTAQLADTDKVRDNAVGTISNVVSAYQTTPVEAKRQAWARSSPPTRASASTNTARKRRKSRACSACCRPRTTRPPSACWASTTR